MTKGFLRIVLTGTFIFCCVSVGAQTGSAYGDYSPYSVFGIGDLSKEGTAYNKSMGGVGVAARNRRFINVMNPASLTSIDSSSFMADFGLAQNNKIFHQKVDGQRITSGNNTFNINNFVVAFPVYKSLACMIGISPFSDIGYDFSSYESDQNIVGNTSTINYYNYGEGSTYQLFIGAGVEPWKNFSVGAEFIYIFGTLDKVVGTSFYDAAYQDITAGSNMVIRATTGKFGVQYDQPFGKNMHLVLGATYRIGSKIKGTTDVYQYGDQSSVRDTISYSTLKNKDGLKLGDQLGIGVALRKGEKWTVEVDYLMSNWKNTGMDNVAYTGTQNNGYTASLAHSVRAGFEYVPNRNDIRYYLRRVTYRAGVYYNQSYYKYNGNQVSEKGITFGVTLPVYRLYNGLTIGFDLGQKGRLKDDMVRELYGTINISFNIHDIWFRKPKYD